MISDKTNEDGAMQPRLGQDETADLLYMKQGNNIQDESIFIKLKKVFWCY